MYGIEHLSLLAGREPMAGRRSTNNATRRENIWIYIAVAVMAAMLALALYGYFTGAWEQPSGN